MVKVSDVVLECVSKHAGFGIKWLERLRDGQPDWQKLTRELKEFETIDPRIWVFIRNRLTFNELCRVGWCQDWTDRGHLMELNTIDYPTDYNANVLKRIRSLLDGIDLTEFDPDTEFTFPPKADITFRELVMTVACCSVAASECHHYMVGKGVECRSNELPYGRYYVGDLCYVLSDEDWHECCEQMDKSQGDVRTMSDGRKFFMQTTQVGDGVFFDEKGRNYSVDSGTIGIMLVDDLSKPEGIDPDHNQVIWQGYPFMSVWEDGLIVYGPIRIHTIDDDEELDSERY